MENVEHHQHAATRLSLSPPRPPSRSAPLSPDSAAAEALANARWTPTKEQIGVLEELYQQGMRTPTAEQIKQVTTRLREHGPIEGKNVFYWFQNHKARQRQRQKQQTFDYFSKQFHRPQPLPMLHRASGHPIHRATPLPFQVPRQQAACNGEVMYMQQQQGYVTTGQAVAHAVYYTAQQQQQQLKQLQQQQQQGYVPSHNPRDKVTAQRTPSGAMYYQYPAPTNAGAQQQPRAVHYPPATGVHAGIDARPVQGRTLNLFPLHPTFAQREKKTQRPGTAGSTVPSASASYSWESEISESHNDDASVPFFDFFGLGSEGL